MSFRVADTTIQARLKSQISKSRQRIATAQEQLASGKKINRPSDNPADANAVIRLRTSQAELKQFGRSASTATETLQNGDVVIDSYQQLLDRARALLTRAGSDTAINEGKESVAIELDGIIERIRQVANTKNGDGYLFGGSRVDAPPFDANGVLATTTAVEIKLQVEPEGTLVSTGVLAENVFADATGNILDPLKAASAGIRGTGNPTADRASVLAGLDRLRTFSDISNVARTQVGERLNHVEEVNSRLTNTNLSLEGTANRLESIDIAEAALNLTESNNALEAILQSAAKVGQRNLLDLLG